MSTALHSKQSYPRACDVCGHRWPKFSDLRYVGLNMWACKDDAAFWQTREEYIRHMRKPVPQMFKPRRHPRPMSNVGVYWIEEGVIAETVNRYATTADTLSLTGAITGAAHNGGMAWCATYLGDMIVEDDRPDFWIAGAKRTLATILDLLLVAQYGAPNGPAAASNTIAYGGVDTTQASVVFPDFEASIGEAFLLGYQIFGDTKYLDGAIRAGNFFRNAQRCDLMTFYYPTFTDGGTDRRYLGGWSASYQTTGQKPVSGVFPTWAGYALRFLCKLRDVVGGSMVFGTVAGGDFVSDTTATLDIMISEARDFYVLGVSPASSAAKVPPYNSAAPKALFQSRMSVASGFDGEWHLDSDVLSVLATFEYCNGLLGLFSTDGYAGVVREIYEWLLTFTSNVAFEPLVGQTPMAVEDTTRGVYDPDLCIASSLTVPSSVTTDKMNASTTLDLRTAARLTDIRAASGRDHLRIKEALTTKRRIDSGAMAAEGASGAQWMGLRMTAGLGFQYPSSATGGRIDVKVAALNGRFYRFPPQGMGTL